MEESEKNWWEEKEHGYYGPPIDRSLLEGKLEGGRKIKAAQEYISAFPDSREDFHYLFESEPLSTYWTDGAGYHFAHSDVRRHDGPLYGNHILYIELFFDLFEYADERDFIRKAVNITVGAFFRTHNREGSDAILDLQLWHHFSTHVDDYVEHLSHDREAVISLLRFFTMDQYLGSGDDRFHHAWVNYGANELCLTSVNAMKLCRAAGLIDIPLFDDIAAVLECGDRVDADCAHAARGGAFHARLADWANDNARKLNAAFRPGSGEAMNYLPVLYMMSRYLADDLRELPLLEAKLYINHPKLSMMWLASKQGSIRKQGRVIRLDPNEKQDFERAKGLGARLFFKPPCKPGGYRELATESWRLGRALISRYGEYLTEGKNLFFQNKFSTYRVDGALFVNRYDVKELLKHWEEAQAGVQEDPLSHCYRMRQQQ